MKSAQLNNSLNLPSKMLSEWQEIVNYLADFALVPASLIMKIKSDSISVLVSSDTENNPYHVGDSETLKGELYCESVIESQSHLLVPNALEDPDWDNNPDIKLGMISYCGFPVNWPNNQPFGTICLLDKKTNAYTDQQIQLLGIFKNMVESNLSVLYQKIMLENKVVDRTRQLSDVNSQLTQAIDEKESSQKLVKLLKYYDRITELPNLNQLKQQVKKKTLTFKEDTFFINIRLSNISHLIDKYGYSINDTLLKSVAKSINALDSHLSVYHHSPYEFLCLYYDDSLQPVLKTSQKIYRILRNSDFSIDEKMTPEFSFGIARVTAEESFLETLRQACYASTVGQSLPERISLYDHNQDHETSITEKIHIESEHAVDNLELALHYQPFICVNTGTVFGCEALLRWNNKKLGFIAPDQFIPIIESSGKIIEFGLFVLRTAIEQTRHWLEYHPDFVMAINISPLQLKDEMFAYHVQHLLKLYNVPANNIELEFTENIFLGNDLNISNNIQKLSGFNIKLSLDDFGTGYSSLSYLHKYPFNTVKIDKEFIGNIEHSEKCCHLIKSIVSMAKGLNLTTVAEGVENKKHIHFCRSCGVNIFQGYYYSKPIPAEDFYVKFIASKGG